MGWIPYPTALSGNAGTPQAAAQQQAMGRAQAQMSHPQLLGQLLRGGGQGMAAQPQAQPAQQMAQPPAGQGADPFAAARAAVAQHTGQAMPQAAPQPTSQGGQGGAQGSQFGLLDPSTLSSSAQSGLDNLKQMIGRKSDRRLKSEVSRIGTLPNGLPIYRYRLEGGPFEVGCMADEVAVVRPDATWIDPDDGFARVDYRKAVL